MNKERLLRLARDILPNVPEENFDLGMWKCGTSACAVGWAACDPQFNKEGFRLQEFSNHRFQPYYEISECRSWEAVERFFELRNKDAEYLFSGEAYRSAAYCYWSATKKQVIERIEEFVAGGGAP